MAGSPLKRQRKSGMSADDIHEILSWRPISELDQFDASIGNRAADEYGLFVQRDQVSRGFRQHANSTRLRVIYDERGNVLTGSLADYPVPTTAEIPSIEIHRLETLTEASVTGAIEASG